MKLKHCGPSSTKTTLSSKYGDRRWFCADWHAFCKAIYKRIEGKEWKGKATGAKKPSESHKSERPLGNKAAKDWGEEYYDPARKKMIF